MLLDTHIFLYIVGGTSISLPTSMREAIGENAGRLHVSVASLWEIAIKLRTGKLGLGTSLDELPGFCRQEGLTILPITAAHVLAELAELPPTRDPFDRLLLAQAQIEGLALMTLDRALAGHPLAWRGPS